MKGNLLRNEQGQMGLFYSEPLGFTPEWAAIDIERGELSVYDNDDNMKMILMHGMSDDMYRQVMKEQRLFLVEVADNDATKPVNAAWVDLMVSQQI